MKQMIPKTAAALALLIHHCAAQTCEVTGPHCEIETGTDDVTCETSSSSESTTVSGCDHVTPCEIGGSTATCDDSADNSPDVVSCDNIYCSETVCQRATIEDSGYIECSDHYGCSLATISTAEHVNCEGQSSCTYVTISDVDYIECSGAGSCLTGTTIADIPEDASIDCTNNHACYYNDFTSETAFTLTCYGGYQGNCYGIDVTNPGGSLFCGGGGNEDCDSATINESIGCLVCGRDDACDNIKIVDDNGTTKETINGLYVHDSCTAEQIVAYLNKVFPGKNTEYQNVIEAYCDNNTDDDNCVEEFAWTGIGSWEKGEI